jgi:hypothetical protein
LKQPENNHHFELVRKPSSAIEKIVPGANRILSGMVADTLQLTKPRFTVLVGDSNSCSETGNGCWADLIEAIIKIEWEDRHSLKFIFFKYETELLKLVKGEVFDLIFLYVSNVRWNTGNPIVTADFSKPIEVLKQIKTQYGKPIVAMQGFDLSKEFQGTGIIFLEPPFTVEEFQSITKQFFQFKNSLK